MHPKLLTLKISDDARCLLILGPPTTATAASNPRSREVMSRADAIWLSAEERPMLEHKETRQSRRTISSADLNERAQIKKLGSLATE
jgi:hypothetical protein